MPPLSPPDHTLYRLRWRGHEEQPASLGTIRNRLDEGEIGLLHEIMAQGRWTTLGDFLESLEHQRRTEEEARAQRTRDTEQRRLALLQQTAQEDARRQAEFSHREPEIGDSRPAPPHPPHHELPPGPYPPAVARSSARPTSGLAIAAFVLSLLNFVPFVNVVSWLLAIIFGHIAFENQRRPYPGWPGPGRRGFGHHLRPARARVLRCLDLPPGRRPHAPVLNNSRLTYRIRPPCLQASLSTNPPTSTVTNS